MPTSSPPPGSLRRTAADPPGIVAAVDTAEKTPSTRLARRSLNLLWRVGSAVVLLALVGATLWVGFVAVSALVVAAALLGAWELKRLLARAGVDPPGWLLYPLTAWLALSFSIPGVPRAAVAPLGAAVVVGLLAAVLTKTSMASWAAAVGGSAYLGLSLAYYVALYRWRSGDTAHFGLRLLVLVLLCAIVNDTAAYFAGSAWGRHGFFASISPRKSMEGAVGGLVAAVVVGAATSSVLVGLAPWLGAVLGLLVAVAAQGGDLVESSLKRQAGVKDSSSLIPGHGGLLDRVDSLVLVAPVVYCYLSVIAL
jgi:phosphatidate cytidylyltransferase